VWIDISGWQIVQLGRLGSIIVTGCRKWLSEHRLRWFWCRLSVLAGWSWTHSFAHSSCRRILCGAMLPRKTSVHSILTTHSWVSLYCSLDLFMTRKLNSPLLLFSDFSVTCLDKVLSFLYCCTQKPSFGHFGHIWCQVQVGLFKLDPTSLPCHSSRHVENLQEISCYLQQWDLATICFINASVATSTLITAWFVHSRGYLSRNLYAKIQELTTS